MFHAVVMKGGGDIAIKDFLSYMKFLDNPSGKLKAGLSYCKCFNGSFWPATEKFVSSLVSFEYENNWWMFDFKMGRTKFIMRRIVNKILRILHLGFLIRTGENSYYTNIDEQRFYELARQYVDDIFTPLVSSYHKHVILDQSISIYNYANEIKFLRNAKFIVVDRDPRDNYTDLINVNYSIGREFAKHRSVDRYIAMHKFSRSNQKLLKKDPNVLFLKFEDIIFHYDETLKLITDFVGLDMNDHVHKREFFNPDISIKNVGMWKNILSQPEVDAITSELSDFLYVR